MKNSNNFEPLLTRPRILDELDAELASRRLREFVLQAWPIVEPSTPFMFGWPLDAIVEHLEAVTRGDIRNLLINVGPKGDGSIPDMQKRPLLELGEWLKGNGEAIYGTRSWTRSEGTTLENKPVRFTKKDDCLYVIIIDECIGECLTITDVPIQDTSSIHLLGSDVGNLLWERYEGGVRMTLPHTIPQQHAYTLKITGM